MPNSPWSSSHWPFFGSWTEGHPEAADLEALTRATPSAWNGPPAPLLSLPTYQAGCFLPFGPSPQSHPLQGLPSPHVLLRNTCLLSSRQCPPHSVFPGLQPASTSATFHAGQEPRVFCSPPCAQQLALCLIQRRQQNKIWQPQPRSEHFFQLWPTAAVQPLNE